jgi:hypothetical protein
MISSGPFVITVNRSLSPPNMPVDILSSTGYIYFVDEYGYYVYYTDPVTGYYGAAHTIPFSGNQGTMYLPVWEEPSPISATLYAVVTTNAPAYPLINPVTMTETVESFWDATVV